MPQRQSQPPHPQQRSKRFQQSQLPRPQQRSQRFQRPQLPHPQQRLHRQRPNRLFQLLLLLLVLSIRSVRPSLFLTVTYLPRRLPFVKMNGLGNDFIIADLQTEPAWARVLAQPELIRRLCDRHTGIGADGILAVLEPSRTDSVATMQVHNADGSRAEMCGNGLRCVARYLHDRGGASRLGPVLHVDTDVGPLRCELTLSPDQLVTAIEINMGCPVVMEPAQMQLVLPQEPQPLELTLISMGNPHAVLFCDQAESYDALRLWAERIGPQVERHPLFPQRTNVELVRRSPASPNGLDVVVWERGCGVTQACGTGACAAVVAAGRLGWLPLGTRALVRLPGGLLDVMCEKDLSAVWMRGPAETVFFGEVETSSIMALDGAAK